MTQEDPSLFEITRCKQGFTLKENSSGQEMHSQVGPWTEANEVYVAQSALETKLALEQPEGQGPLVIYDVGMGTAANAVAAIQKYRALGSTRALEIISFENKPAALDLALGAPAQFPFLTQFHDALRTLLRARFVTLESKISWRLLDGDFRDADFSVIPAPELIYFDFYTPAYCPELWTEEVFAKLFEKCEKSSKKFNDTFLITYSAAKSVRSAMLLAGFYVGSGSPTDLKLETTLAASRIEALKKPLGADWWNSLERSGKPFSPEVPQSAYAETFKRLKRHPQFKLL